MMRILTALCLILFATGHTVAHAQDSSLRTEIANALSTEIPQARQHLGSNQNSAKVDGTYLLDAEVLNVAEVIVSQTMKDKLFGSMALVLPGTDFGISVSSLPVDQGNWPKAIARFEAASFDKISAHYAGQAAGVPSIKSFIHIYLGLDDSGSVAAAVGISDLTDQKQSFPPRQFASSSQGEVTLSLSDLPAKRCDVDTDGLVIAPGEGYLLSPEQVEKSEKYWASLNQETRVLMEQMIKNDRSPWLVSEKHIDKFDIDKVEARKRAVNMWNKELEAKNSQ